MRRARHSRRKLIPLRAVYPHGYEAISKPSRGCRSKARSTVKASLTWIDDPHASCPKQTLRGMEPCWVWSFRVPSRAVSAGKDMSCCFGTLTIDGFKCGRIQILPSSTLLRYKPCTVFPDDKVPVSRITRQEVCLDTAAWLTVC